MQSTKMHRFLFFALLHCVSAAKRSGVNLSGARIDCHGDRHPSKAECLRRGCIWNESLATAARINQQSKEIKWDRPIGPPICSFATNSGYGFAGYDVIDKYELRRRNTPSLYGDDVERLNIKTEYFQGGLSITIQSKTDELDVSEFDRSFLRMTAKDLEPGLQVSYTKSPFGMRIKRRKGGRSGVVLFDSVGIPGLTFSRQFIQISFHMNSRKLYGWGEQYHETMMRIFDWRRLSIMSLDEDPFPGTNNLYGHHPFLLGLDENNEAFGLYFHNSHPMDLQLQPNPDIITFRAIGGKLKFLFFAGPKPGDVVQQYTGIIGRPFMPPYWYLGFQLSRYGYHNASDLKKVWDRNRNARIPQDVQMIDIDYMDEFKDFTVDQNRYSRQNFDAFLKNDIHGTSRKLMLIVDPPISTDPQYPSHLKGLELGIFINDSKSNAPILSKGWPGPVNFPDFSNPRTQRYYDEQLSQFHGDIVPFDGIWLDMNEPAAMVNGSVTGCQNNSWNNPPYSPVSYEPIYTKTLCLDSQLHRNGSRLYEFHDYYGHMQLVTTYRAMLNIFPDRRPAILTRSTVPGSGSFGAHWTGDVDSSWRSLNQTLIAAMEFSMFGFSMVGSDICGFDGDTTEELCLRWSQVGAFYTFSRNHNCKGQIDQDPAVWSPDTTRRIRKALVLRYSLLPYLYHQMFQAHRNGTTVIRPVFFDYPDDSNTHDIRDQFMWGSSVMIVPILNPNQVSRSAYFPDGGSPWYRFDDYRRQLLSDHIFSMSRSGGRKTVSIDKDQIGVFVRGGSIIATQPSENGDGVESTADGRQQPFQLYIALDHAHHATGYMYWDDGKSVRAVSDKKYCLWKITYTKNPNGTWPELKVESERHGCSSVRPAVPRIATITVVGLYEQRLNERRDSQSLLKLSTRQFNGTTRNYYSAGTGCNENLYEECDEFIIGKQTTFPSVNISLTDFLK